MEHVITRQVAVERTARVKQLEAMFDVPARKESAVQWRIKLPIERRPWNIGLVVGPSGSGKSTLLETAWPAHVVRGFDWPADKALLDGFPAGASIKEITGLLCSVGFSSPPNWLRPFRVLSNGEQFRATLARALAEHPDLVVLDEFTSVVDRTVAQIGSAAVAKTVRRRNQKFVAASCHYDIIDWLQPDWIYEPHTGSFRWRCLQRRPEVVLEVRRGTTELWRYFKAYHYLSGNLHRTARVFVGSIAGRLVAFVAVLAWPHATSPGWREHRLVVLPDFQGIGIGNRLSEYLGSLYVATGRPYRATTGHPAMIAHRLASPLWRCTRRGDLMARPGRTRTTPTGIGRTVATDRIVWSFRYVGPANADDARAFGLL